MNTTNEVFKILHKMNQFYSKNINGLDSMNNCMNEVATGFKLIKPIMILDLYKIGQKELYSLNDLYDYFSICQNKNNVMENIYFNRIKQNKNNINKKNNEILRLIKLINLVNDDSIKNIENRNYFINSKNKIISVLNNKILNNTDMELIDYNELKTFFNDYRNFKLNYS